MLSCVLFREYKAFVDTWAGSGISMDVAKATPSPMVVPTAITTERADAKLPYVGQVSLIQTKEAYELCTERGLHAPSKDVRGEFTLQLLCAGAVL